MKDCLRITSGAITVSPCCKFLAERGVIIDFTVIDDPYSMILVGHRLVALGHIYNGQSPVSESNRSFYPEPLVVRSSMG
jgi:hypothetical protein